tara:strand:- start:330 stop:566 length:237 start_codon:yes stop_codon:yes gene_type:complete
MRLQSSGNGSMIVDFYPTKSWIDSHIFEDKFLKVLTFSGETMVKKVVSHAEMIEEIGSYFLHDYTAISNNTLPQFIRS